MPACRCASRRAVHGHHDFRTLATDEVVNAYVADGADTSTPAVRGGGTCLPGVLRVGGEACGE